MKDQGEVSREEITRLYFEGEVSAPRTIELKDGGMPKDIGLIIDGERIITGPLIHMGDDRPETRRYSYGACWNTKEGDELEISAFYQGSDYQFVGIEKKLDRNGYTTRFK